MNSLKTKKNCVSSSSENCGQLFCNLAHNVMPRKGVPQINPLQLLHLPLQSFCTCECWQLYPSPATSAFNWLTLAREGCKEYKSRQKGGSLKRFLRHHPRYVFGLHTAPPISYLYGVAFKLCPVESLGSMSNFWGVLQAYLIYNKSIILIIFNCIILLSSPSLCIISTGLIFNVNHQ
jgi:hypothetical protein